MNPILFNYSATLGTGPKNGGVFNILTYKNLHNAVHSQ